LSGVAFGRSFIASALPHEDQGDDGADDDEQRGERRVSSQVYLLDLA
jgi:hypothetical protein